MKRTLSPLIGLAALLVSLPARADFETWIWTEIRVPLVRTEKPTFPRLDWRVFTDTRLNVRSGGLHQAFFRTGPLLYVSDWLFIGVHGTVYADRLLKPAGNLQAGDFTQEVRAELEPNFFWRLGDFTFNDRNRLEYRHRSYEDRYRYRNQLRVNYAPIGAKWIPFIWDELLVDLSGKGVNQNRFDIGIGRMMSDQTRVDLGFMIRSRKEDDGWKHDGVVNLYVYVDVPPKAAKR
ncbi:Hypothetical protein A7982_05588 [Minicystis rosea]|nr:Hypothetical protein A7982_05588 [Minicystis rosea]